MKVAMKVMKLIIVLAVCSTASAEVGQILNASFEDDRSIYDITTEAPNEWPDVNAAINATGFDKFGGWVDRDWPTDGSYNLTLYSYISPTVFEANDMVTVSQEVYLTDVYEVIFDLQLDTYPSYTVWDPNVCTALLLIDDEVVWESNSIGSDVSGQYYDQSYSVATGYDDGNPHKLSLGMRMNVDGTSSATYYTFWDNFEFIVCDGLGLAEQDFDQDCDVDFEDYAMLANDWMQAPSKPEYDLFPDGIIDACDLDIFSDNWLRKQD